MDCAKLPATRRCLQRLNAASSRKAPPRICLASREWPKCSSNAVPSGTVALGRWIRWIHVIVCDCQYQTQISIIYEKTICHINSHIFTYIHIHIYHFLYHFCMFLSIICFLGILHVYTGSKWVKLQDPAAKNCPTMP